MAHPLVRAGAVMFSATLLIGFVAFRAGGCAATRPDASRATSPSTTQATSITGFAPSEDFDPVMVSSKSGSIVPVDTSKNFRTMAGSKSMVMTEGGALSGLASPATTQPATGPSEPSR